MAISPSEGPYFSKNITKEYPNVQIRLKNVSIKDISNIHKVGNIENSEDLISC